VGHSKVEHLADLGGRADQGAADRDALADQGEGINRREDVLRRSELDEGAVGAKESEVILTGASARVGESQSFHTK